MAAAKMVDNMAGTNSTTIELLRKYDFTVQKKFGQNFLTDDNVLSGIVDAAGIEPEDTVLEVGPGLGALTARLCRAADRGKVVTVEIDRMLIPVLEESLQDYHNIEVINTDIMKMDLSELGREKLKLGQKFKVVANLPYYITTPVIMKLLEHNSIIQSITVMIQKEVAQRIQERPGSKSYGALSLAVQYYARPEVVMAVSRNCFIPKPEVDSAVIRLDIFEPDERPVKPSDPEKMFRIIRAAFNQRRKTLVNAISNSQELEYTKAQAAEALRKMGKPETVRGESLTLEDFSILSELI